MSNHHKASDDIPMSQKKTAVSSTYVFNDDADLPVTDLVKSPLVPSSRLALALIALVGFANVYAQRVNMSVAVVCMLNHTALEESEALMSPAINASVHVEDSCGSDDVGANATSGPKMDGEFLWSSQEKGLVLGAFFWGYLFTQVPGGMLAERYGGKNVYLYFMLLSAVGTLLCPLAARTHVVLFILMRVLVGIGEGVVFPAMHAMWAHWAPPLERSILVGLAASGSQLGNVVALPVSGWLCYAVGWEAIFYVFGIVGVLWCIGWFLIASDTPNTHRHISDKERKYINASLNATGKKVEHKSPPWSAILRSLPCWAITIAHTTSCFGMYLAFKQMSIPWSTWRSILTSRAVWAIILVHTLANFGTYTVLTVLPTYMRSVHKLDIKSNGLLSSIPYVSFFIVIQFAGHFADWLRRGRMNTGPVRKLMMVISMAGQATFLVLAGYTPCGHSALAITFITFAQALSGFQFAGFLVNHVDIAPKYAGTLFGLSNTFATVSGIVAPYVATALTPQGTPEQWLSVFWVSAAVLIFGMIIYCIFASGELQSWAVDEQDEIDRNVDRLLTNNDHREANGRD